MRKNLILTVAVVVVAGAVVFFWFGVKNNSSKINPPVACTMEAKICPDGSAVGRSGPNCEFAKCPDVAGVIDTIPAITDMILTVGQTGKSGDLNITLNKIAQDSRCPIDVQCVWAGQVETEVTIASFAKSETINISSGKTPVLFGGYHISISSVTPSSKSGEKISTDKYKVTFHIVNSNTGAITKNAIVNGTLTLSPICPVEKNPPDPNCAPKPYPGRKIDVFSADGAELVKTTTSDSNGNFTFTLPYGEYSIEAQGGKPFPRCSPSLLSLNRAAPPAISISCDTGIR